MFIRPSVCLFPLTLCVFACSSSSVAESSGFSSAPLTTGKSTGGSLAVAVRTSPQPPTEGNVEAQLTVTEADGGKPVDGLGVTVVPWMPSMSHGTSVVPTVTATGHGTYVASPIALSMPGEWELRLTFTGPVEDTAAPAFDVP